ncbi:MAG: amidohydrolase [Firmicutes bacterium]|nr:amidohydrolase [Bacillota bacterium]
MELILYNGIIHTMKDDEIVSALAIDNGLIAASGDDCEIFALKTANTKLVDLQRKLVIPGFNDSHMHILAYGLNKRRLEVGGCKTIQEIISKARAYIEKNQKLKLIIGRGWNQDHLPGRLFPSKQDLDEISREIPLILYRVCGHSAVINTKAMEAFNIDENTMPPLGGSFNFDTGLVCEAALDLFQLPELGHDEIKDILVEAIADMQKKGITSAQSDDFGFAAHEEVIKAYSELAAQGDLGIRIYQQNLFYNIEDIRVFLAKQANFPQLTPFYKLGPIKLLSDGSLGARTAFLSCSYKDDSTNTGIACFTQAELDEIVNYCQENSQAVAIHCIGDAALARALNSIEKAVKSCKARGLHLRHGIVHCQISDLPLLNKLKDLNLLAYIQPIFLDYDIHIVEERVGQELAKTSYNFKTLLDLGVHVSLGTDCPVESFDPLPNIYCAVTRKDLQGFPIEGFNASQALKVHEAVYCYTVGSAYCSQEENFKGQLAKGFLADLAVLDRDIFTISAEEIKDARVVMTIVGGKIVYSV